MTDGINAKEISVKHPHSVHPMKPSETVLIFICLLIMFCPAASPGVDPPLAGKEEEPVTALDTIVITVHGQACPASLTPGGVGVVTSEDMDEAHPVSLTDITRHIPGAEKTSDSPWGSDLNIRGLSRNNVLFLIDGCRVNTATDINARFGLVNPWDIERVEVIKGPVSALYGWGAMGGVVNVITRKGKYSTVGRVSGEMAGSLSSNPEGGGLYANAAYGSPDFRLFASGGYRDYDDRETSGGKPLHNSQFQDAYAKLNSGFKWNAYNETIFDFQQIEGRDIGIPGKGLSLPEGPDVTYPETNRMLLALTHTMTPEAMVLTESSVKLYLQEVERLVRLDSFPNASPIDRLEPGADHRTLGMTWTNRFTLDPHSPVVGVDFFEWRIDDSERYRYLKNGRVSIDSSLGNVSQTVGGIFAEDNWSPTEVLTLNIGARIDLSRVESDDLYNWIIPPAAGQTRVLVRKGRTTHDESWQAHAGMTWQFADQWSATAVAAAAYRPPDLMDLFKYIDLGSGVSLYGNPDLDPERSSFFETGLHYVSKRFKGTVSVYANDLSDLITETQKSPSEIRMENVDRALIYGSDLDLQWRITETWTAQADLAWTRGENKTSQEPLPFIAPLNGRFALRYESDGCKGWWTEMAMNWAAAQDRTPAGQNPSENWQTIDLTGGYRFKAMGLDHTWILGVTNLLDENYSNYLSTSRGLELKEAGTSISGTWKIQF